MRIYVNIFDKNFSKKINIKFTYNRISAEQLQ